MSYDASERSRAAGDPVECYRWSAGALTWQQTSADMRVTIDVAPFGPQVYDPAAIRRDDTEFNQEDDSGTLSIQLHRLNPVAALFIPGNPSGAVSLTVYRMHVSDGQVIVAFVGRVAGVTYQGSSVTLQVAPMTAALKRNVPRIQQQRQCVWALYGPGCGVARAGFTDVGTVLDLTNGGVVVRAAVFATRASGWYNTGWLEDAAGNRRAVVSHAGDTCVLQYPFVSLAAGAAITGVAGCLRTSVVCDSKFANRINFMGFEFIPSKDIFRLGIS